MLRRCYCQPEVWPLGIEARLIPRRRVAEACLSANTLQRDLMEHQMHEEMADRAVSAAISTARALGLHVDDAVVLQNSNKLAIRLRSCDTFARIAPLQHQTAEFEIKLAGRLAERGSPAVALEPRVPSRVYERDGFAITFWTYHGPRRADVSPSAYATALAGLHAGLRGIDLPTPHFTDRIAEAGQIGTSRERSPALPDMDRVFLRELLNGLRRTILDRNAPEQLLHGEPYPGNLLSTDIGPLFIDLETCCRGPVEFDLAHAPEAVVAHYPNVDQALLGECRALVLAMVTAWRWDADDEFPNGQVWARRLVAALRDGPPWPSLDAMARALD